MVLLADCGSTKCDWALLQSKASVLRFSSTGFNPSLGLEPAFFVDLQAHLSGSLNEIKEVIFYGAGISENSMVRKIEKYFKQYFPALKKMDIQSDLRGMANLLYEDQPVICCILGTGSNALRYDDQKVFQAVPALGYIVGDEGSGAYFGKSLIRDYFYKMLPQDISKKFEKEYDLTKVKMVRKVYGDGPGNIYLAGFMPFYLKHISSPYILDKIKSGFREFIRYQILPYQPHEKIRIHFIGSVAYYFRNQLEEVLKEYKLTIGKTIKSPIDLMIFNWESQV